VAVGVDETRSDDAPGDIDDLGVAGLRRQVWADRRDPGPTDEQVADDRGRGRGVDGDERPAAEQDGRGQGVAPPGEPSLLIANALGTWRPLVSATGLG